MAKKKATPWVIPSASPVQFSTIWITLDIDSHFPVGPHECGNPPTRHHFCGFTCLTVKSRCGISFLFLVLQNSCSFRQTKDMRSQPQSGELPFLSALGISPAAAGATLNGSAAVAASKAVTKNRHEKTVEKAEVVQAAQTVLMGFAFLRGRCGTHNKLLDLLGYGNILYAYYHHGVMGMVIGIMIRMNYCNSQPFGGHDKSCRIMPVCGGCPAINDSVGIAFSCRPPFRRALQPPC